MTPSLSSAPTAGGVSLIALNDKVTELEAKLNKTQGLAFKTKEGSKAREELRKETQKLNNEINKLANTKLDQPMLKKCADLRVKLDKLNSKILNIDDQIDKNNKSSKFYFIITFLKLSGLLLEKEIKPIEYQDFAKTIYEERQKAVEVEMKTYLDTQTSVDEKMKTVATIITDQEKVCWTTKNEDEEGVYTIHYKGKGGESSEIRVFSLDVGYYAPEIDNKKTFQSLSELVEKTGAIALSTATAKLRQAQADSLKQYHNVPGYPKNKVEVEAQFKTSHDDQISERNLYALVKETDGSYSLYLRPDNPTDTVVPQKLEITEVGKIKIGDTLYNTFEDVKAASGLALNEDTISQALQKASEKTLESDNSFNVGCKDKLSAEKTLQTVYTASSDKSKGFYLIWKDATNTFHLSRITPDNKIHHHEIRLNTPPGAIMVGSFTEEANDIKVFAATNKFGEPKGLTSLAQRIEDGHKYFDKRPESNLGNRATEALKKRGENASCYAMKFDPTTNKVELHIFPKQTKWLFWSASEIPTFEIQPNGTIYSAKDNKSFETFSDLIEEYKLSETPSLSAIEKGFNTLQTKAEELRYPFKTKDEAQTLVQDAKDILGEKTYSQTCVMYEEKGQLHLIQGKNIMTLSLREDGSLICFSGFLGRTRQEYGSFEALVEALKVRPTNDIQNEITQRKALLKDVQNNKEVYCQNLAELKQAVAVYGKDVNGMFAFDFDNETPRNLRLHYVENGQLTTKTINTTSPEAFKKLGSLQGNALIDKLKELSGVQNLQATASNTFSKLRSDYEKIQEARTALKTRQEIYAAKEAETQKQKLQYAITELGPVAYGGYILCEHPTEKGFLNAYMQDEKGLHTYTLNLKAHPGEILVGTNRYSAQPLDPLGFKLPYSSKLKTMLAQKQLKEKNVLDGNQNIGSLEDEPVVHWAQRACTLGDHAKNVWFTRKEAPPPTGLAKTLWSYGAWAASGFKSTGQEESAPKFFLDVMTRRGNTMTVTENPITITPTAEGNVQYKITGKDATYDTVEELARSLVQPNESVLKVDDLKTMWDKVNATDDKLRREEIEAPEGKAYDELVQEANAFDNKQSHYIINKKREPSETAFITVGSTHKETGLLDDKMRDITWIQEGTVKYADIDILREPGKFWAIWDGQERSFDTLDSLINHVCGRDCTSAKPVLEMKKNQEKLEAAQKLELEQQKLKTKKLNIIEITKTSYVLVGNNPEERLRNLKDRVTNADHLSTDEDIKFNKDLCVNMLQHILQKDSYTDQELQNEYTKIKDPGLKLLFVKIAAAASDTFTEKLPKIPLSHYVVVFNYSQLGKTHRERLDTLKAKVEQPFDLDKISKKTTQYLVLAIMGYPPEAEWPKQKNPLATLRKNCNDTKLPIGSDPDFVALRTKAFG